MEQEYVPFFPRGWPASSAFSEHLEQVFIYAKIDITRAIEPSLSLDEQRAGKRPADDVLLKRFTDRVIRWIGRLAGHTRIVIILPWRVREDQHIRSYLSELAYRIPKIPTGIGARYVLLVEGVAAEEDFTRFSGVPFTEQTWGTTYGSFFLIRWPPTNAPKTLARMLRAFLDGRADVHSVLPPSPANAPPQIHTSPTQPPPPDTGLYPESMRAPGTSGGTREPLRRSTSRFRAAKDILTSTFRERASSDHEIESDPESDRKP